MAQAGGNAQMALLKFTSVALNAGLLSAPAPAALSENLLDREVFDYDFSRERVFLEIADAEIEARRQAEAAKARVSDKADSDEELSRQSAKLSLSGGPKPRSASEEDVAAAISASLREY